MAMFDFLKKPVAHKRSVSSAIEQLLREREDVANARAHRSDVKRLFDEQFARWEQVYAKSLQQHLEPVVRSLGSFAGPERAENASRYLSVTSIQPGLSQSPTPRSLDMALFALLGAQLKPAFYAAIDALDWTGEGLPMAERAAKLADIDRRLDALKREELELVQALAEAGLTLTSEARETVGSTRRARTDAA